MIVSELQDRLWQLKFSDDKDDFWNWFKSNAEVILKRMAELEETNTDADHLRDENANLEDEVHSANSKADELEEELDDLADDLRDSKILCSEFEWELNAWLS